MTNPSKKTPSTRPAKAQQSPSVGGKKAMNHKSNSSNNNNMKRHSTTRCTVEPPFKLYADESNPSFAEGWTSVVKLLQGRKNIAVLTGAGISVSCGIPDFRTKESGLYSILDAEALGLSCPEDIFDSHFFHENPAPFYKFARQLYFPLGVGDESDEKHPKRVRPSDSHKLLALLEQKKLLLRVYSQNIDGLEEEAGVSAKRVCYAHGSLQWATCCKCKRRVSSKEIEMDVLNGTVAYCQAPAAATANVSSAQMREPSARAAAASRKRSRLAGDDENHANSVNHGNNTVGRNGEAVCGGVMKPGVTFFGEALHNNVKSKLESDRQKVDALIVIGTSLSVAPISKVIDYLPKNIPRILINRTIVHPPEVADDNDETNGEIADREFRENYVFDAYLLGYCDDVTRALGKRLFSTGGSTSDHACEVGFDEEGELLACVMKASESAFTPSDWRAVTVPTQRVFLFPGAEAPSGVSEVVSFCEIARCDGCSKQIEGTIQKCLVCFDYDLCQVCFPTLSKTHYDGQHHFAAEPVTSIK